MNEQVLRRREADRQECRLEIRGFAVAPNSTEHIRNDSPQNHINQIPSRRFDRREIERPAARLGESSRYQFAIVVSAEVLVLRQHKQHLQSARGAAAVFSKGVSEHGSAGPLVVVGPPVVEPKRLVTFFGDVCPVKRPRQHRIVDHLTAQHRTQGLIAWERPIDVARQCLHRGESASPLLPVRTFKCIPEPTIGLGGTRPPVVLGNPCGTSR
ncbi:hypothetical protein NWT09_31065 [Mycolicibacterium sp. jd]|uniref:hypothetical protein n=1 Tax=unclassified Mycolicibacterium TaxID=2636767 RepID=UPI00351BD91C